MQSVLPFYGRSKYVLLRRDTEFSLPVFCRLLLLDEPASSLDFGHQIRLLDTLVTLKNSGMALLMSTHHPLHARAIADSVVRVEPNGAVSQGLPEQQLEEIKHGSWLHDCGKIGVPERVLNHPGKLNEDDMESVMQHPRWGSDVARQAHMSEVVVNVILYHHERFDGAGYPSGLKGDEIPIEARIVAIADVFDALYSDRPYRKAYSLERALEIMQEMTATHFDPELVKTFLPLAEQEACYHE